MSWGFTEVQEGGAQRCKDDWCDVTHHCGRREFAEVEEVQLLMAAQFISTTGRYWCWTKNTLEPSSNQSLQVTTFAV